MRHELTADGSSTMFAEAYNALYHSHHGALTESEHVFINAGLRYFGHTASPLKVLEYGFGTGLNAFLSWIYADHEGILLHYHSLEKHPLSSTNVDILNYATLRGRREWLDIIHRSDWGAEQLLHPNFLFTKYALDFCSFETDEKFDIIFYDAFAPTIQPELWTAEAMRRCYEQLRTDGILVTFCAKGSFKRALKEVGFRIESLPGPPRKREMTRAVKC